MNNDLEQFSEERLKDMQKHVTAGMTLGHADALLIRQAIDIALAAKQAKPVTDDVLRIMQEEWDEWCSDTGCFPDDFEWKGGNGTLSFEASRWAARIAARVSNLATPQPAHTEQVIPDGWKLVPIEPTIGMLINGVIAGVNASPDPWCPHVWAAMLAAAPKPESEL